jgi:deoxyribose-phosphate aldolase
LKNGADEVDVVIHIGMLKSGRTDDIRAELSTLREACRGRILKVIIETCLLSEPEKIEMCGIVTEVGADFIKTSTGFSKGGATVEDVRLLRKHVGPLVRVKAAGGISSLEDAEAMMAAGAARLGTSRIVKIIAGAAGGGY